MSRTSTKDWRNLPIEKWNVTTFHQLIIDRTKQLYDIEYLPTGAGSRSHRWSREKGMLKNAQEQYGNSVLRRFIELCFENYTPKAEYPYVTFTFMYSYMDRYFAQAQTEVARERARELRRAEREESVEVIDEMIELL